MDAPIKIFGIPQSRAARCLWMAREAGVPYENLQVHFTKTLESPELLAVNPNGRLPALDDNGFHLFESMAINLYLAKKYGADKGLQPATLEDEARAIQWSIWAMTEVEKPLLALLLHAFGMQALDEAGIKQQAETLDRPLKVLDAHLAKQACMLGGQFTVADLNAASVLAWARFSKFDLSGYPHVDAWLTRCLSRPAANG